MKKFKVGIIGCGNIANGKHMRTLAKFDDVEMVAFCDIIPERAEAAKKKFGTPDAKCYTDYRELLADPAVDNVRVLTHNGMHCRITVDALNAGKHVICEKPMSITYAEAQEMIEARDRSGKVLAIGYQHKFDPDALYLKAEAENGTFGEIYHGKCQVLRRRGAPTYGYFLSEKDQGAGPLFDIATHSLDLLLYITNNYEPKAVLGMTHARLKDNPDGANLFGTWKPEDFTVEDSAFAMITMKNGASFILECSWLLNAIMREGEGVRYTICGTEAGADNFGGVLTLNSVKHGCKLTTSPDLSAGSVAFYEGSSKEPVELEQRNFFDAIEGKAELINTPERAAVVTKILEAIKVSSQTGKAVYFD